MDIRQVFPQFDQQLTEELLRIGQVVEFEEGELLMRTGQYFKSSLILLEGTVKLYREGEEGEEFFLYYLEKGHACALSLICGIRQEASQIKAKVVAPVKALSIPLQHMDQLMKNHQGWYYFVLENYRTRFEELLQVVDQVVFHSMDEKLELYLQRQFRNFRSDTVNITHQEIAADLNSSREVISRLLKKLETQRRIQISRNAIKNISL